MPFVAIAAIGAAGAIGGAAIASHSAGKAADKQVAASDKALALQKEIYDQQRQDLAPYTRAGAQAVTTLGALMGLGGGPSGPSGPPPTVPMGGMPGPMQQQFNQQRRAERPMPGEGGPGAGPGSAAGFAGPTIPGGGGSDFVQMRAPDGEVRAVPRALVPKIQAAGGVLVSGGM